MELKCEYCGAFMNDTDKTCPNCGAVNKHHKRVADHTPKTIEELKKWYEDRNLPPYETTRFFIGIDYKKPKAFGIYEENGEFIVYKNKADGSRAVRYRGSDEAYAVNEIYLKLKSEILNQKAHNASSTGKKSVKRSGRPARDSLTTFLGVCGMFFAFAGFSLMGPLRLAIYLALTLGVLLVLVFIPACSSWFKNKKYRIIFLVYALILFFVMVGRGVTGGTPHYYKYNDSVYCLYDNDYYEYDSYSRDYTEVNRDYIPVEVLNNGPDYEFNMDGSEWKTSYSFEDSDYYEENLRSTHEWGSSDGGGGGGYDSSYDWDSSSDWDSGSSDWDSDW